MNSERETGVMGLALAAVADQAGLRVLVSAEAAEVTGGYVVEADGSAGVDEPRPTDLAVLRWDGSTAAASRQPLELVLGRIQHRLQPNAVAVAVDAPDVPPSRAAVVAANKMGVGLLWAGERADVVADRVRRVIDSATHDDGQGLVTVLAGDPGLASLTERLAEQLDAAGLIVREGVNGVLTLEIGDTLDATKVYAADLLHSGVVVGSIGVFRDHPLRPEEERLLETLNGMLAMALRLHGADRVQIAPAQAQLSLILGDNLQSREAALRRSRRLRLFPPRRMRLAVVEPFAEPLGYSGLVRLSAQLEPPMRHVDPRATQVVFDGGVVVLFGADADLENMRRGFRRATSVPLSFGLSRPFDEMRAAPGAHREASRAAAIGRRLGAANQITRYDDLGLLSLLYRLPEHERRGYVREVLGPIAGPDPEAADHRRTLRALVAARFSLAEAGRELFIHRNTLRLRIARLEAVLGPFIEDPKRQMAVAVALEIHRLDEER